MISIPDFLWGLLGILLIIQKLERADKAVYVCIVWTSSCGLEVSSELCVYCFKHFNWKLNIKPNRSAPHWTIRQACKANGPRQLRRCTLCSTHAIGDERHYVFGCLHFAHIRQRSRLLFQHADGAMQSFLWHRNQKAVCHCLAAILTLADDSSMDVSS